MTYSYIQSFASGKVLDIAGNQGRAGATVNCDPKKYPPNMDQLWRVEPTGDGAFWLVSGVNPNVVLDVQGNSSAPGARIIVWHRKFPPAPNQLWYWDENMLASRMNPGMVVDVDGGNGRSVILWQKHGGANQRWLFQVGM